MTNTYTVSVKRTWEHTINTNRTEIAKYKYDLKYLLDNDLKENDKIVIRRHKVDFSGIAVTFEVKHQDSNSKLKEAKYRLLDEWIYCFDNYTPVEAANAFVRTMPYYEECREDIANFITSQRAA